MNEVHVLFKFAKNPYGGREIDTTSSSGQFRDLSPFILGPIVLPGIYSRNFENLWQYSKCYRGQMGSDGLPAPAWFAWRDEGWASQRARRYPMGKGAVPEFSWWDDEKLGYIAARKRIYATVYSQFVRKTESYIRLENIYRSGETLVLRDFDAYDHLAQGRTLTQVLNDPTKRCGHAFILAMMLQGEI